VGTPDNWRGVYNHYDSYPTGLGEDLWGVLVGETTEETENAEGAGDPVAVIDALARYGDWREYLNGGQCQHCGKTGVGQPHSYSMSPDAIKWDIENNQKPKHPAEIEAHNNFHETGFPDPEAKWHKHAAGEVLPFSSESPDPLSIEWVYVIDPDGTKLYILTFQSCTVEGRENGEIQNEVHIGDGAWDYGHCVYRHALVVTLDIKPDNFPNWENIEQIGYDLPEHKMKAA
jgi:hypothetical protein